MSDSRDVRSATLDEAASQQQAVRAHWLRRAALAVLTVILLVAVSGVLDREVTALTRGQDGEATMEITHQRLLRSGADVSVVVRVSTSADEVTVEVPRALFEQLGVDTLWPEPESQTSHGARVRLTYPNPTGEVSFEAVGRLSTTESPGSRAFDVSVPESGLTHRLTVWVLP